MDEIQQGSNLKKDINATRQSQERLLRNENFVMSLKTGDKEILAAVP